MSKRLQNTTLFEKHALFQLRRNAKKKKKEQLKAISSFSQLE